MNGKRLRVIKYQIPSHTQKLLIVKNNQGDKPFKIVKHSNNYYLCTSLIDKETYPINKLKDLYHQRWTVEEYYKIIKRNLHTGTFHSILPESIECEMLVQQMITLITRLFIGLMTPDNGRIINYKITTNQITNHILPTLIFDKHSISYLQTTLNMLEILEQNTVAIIPNRSYPRVKRFCSDKYRCKNDK